MLVAKDFSAKKIGGKPAEIVSAAEKVPTAVFSAPQNVRYHLACSLKRFLLVTTDRVASRNAAEVLSAYCGEEIPVITEREDTLIYSRAVNAYSLGERLKVLGKLLDNSLKGAVISAEGLLQFYPDKNIFSSYLTRLNKGMELKQDELISRLIQMGYEREETAEERGTFATRGDTVSLFGFDTEYPVRIEFFGDEIDAIKTFDRDSYKTIENLDGFIVLPASDILVPEKAVKGIAKKISALGKDAPEKLREKLADSMTKFMLNPSSPANGFLLPFMHEYMGSILDYLPQDTVVVFDDVRSFEDKIKLLRNSFALRVAGFCEAGEADKMHLDSIHTVNEVYEAVRSLPILGFLPVTAANSLFTPSETFALNAKDTISYSNVELLARDLKIGLTSGMQTFIMCAPSTADALEDALHLNYVGVKRITELSQAAEINLIASEVPYGFTYPQEKFALFGQNNIARKKEAAKKKRKRRDFILPEKGDYVVHEKHGIGISEGLQSVKTLYGEKDFYVISYRGGDKLYLPASHLDSLEKYTGAENPTVHKLGGAEFERVKTRAKASIKKLTIDLLKLYEKRLTQKGHRYPAETLWEKELKESFEFAETEDQTAAIDDITSDMEAGKIMDRLLCGDVGYGKTEVAVRAIFKTVLEKKQAAFLAPTTILAQQHFNTITARLNRYKLNIVLLSRFVSQKQIKESLKKIASGEANIIVGTHRMLSADVHFHDLGLLVLDEEQRFGVEHKEKIKNLRNKVNVLSLSATPIPRTLHMSLTGIRDISLLETPPTNRLPVETYVVEYSDTLLLDAVRREVSRGGQVFILYNRVASIESFFNHVQDLIGDIPAIYAHGQMSDEELEDRIKQFYDREASVMVSTTIIENGIDLPYANTLIVIDSDMLGMSQLYQLRGRVGRSNVQAYAYFTVKQGKALTETAVKRLEALMQNTDLGSGFNVAMRDLDIRGAGNILGKEQSGEMEKIGYDMYCKLIKECMEEASGIESTEKSKEVEVLVEGDTTLPKNYITDSRGRIKFYKRVSDLSSMQEAKDFTAEIKDAYGEPPYSVTLLISVALIKNLARSMGIRKVVIGKTGYASMYFSDEGLFRSEKVIEAVSKTTDAVISTTSPPMVTIKKHASVPAKIALALKFLSMAAV